MEQSAFEAERLLNELIFVDKKNTENKYSAISSVLDIMLGVK